MSNVICISFHFVSRLSSILAFSPSSVILAHLESNCASRSLLFSTRRTLSNRCHNLSDNSAYHHLHHPQQHLLPSTCHPISLFFLLFIIVIIDFHIFYFRDFDNEHHTLTHHLSFSHIVPIILIIHNNLLHFSID